MALVEKLGNINEALKRQETPNIWHKNCVDMAIEKAVIEFSIEHPHPGQQKVAMKLTGALGIDISPNGVRSVWLRNNMNTTALRVGKSQSIQKSA